MNDRGQVNIYLPIKRILDIMGALIGIILFVILYIILGILIKVESNGPIIVGLKRVSNGKIITLYKFRSMVKDASKKKSSLQHLNQRSDGPFFKIKNDPRITLIGKVIRKLRLDEVPQFINVLIGNLSLVGPRPHEPEEVNQYPEKFQFLKNQKSGITGLSQVNGASSLPFIMELELDKQYIENQSFLLDIKIIFKTIAILLFDPTAV